MRQEKTDKIVANHYIINQDPFCILTNNDGNVKTLVWSAQDSADEVAIEQFALRFKTEEIANEFRDAFNEAKASNATCQALIDAGAGGDDTSPVAAASPAQLDNSLPKPATPGLQAKGSTPPWKTDVADSPGGAAGAATGGFTFGSAGDNSFQPTDTSNALSGVGGGFTFGGASGGFSFGGDTASGGLFGAPASGGLFGAPPATEGNGSVFAPAANTGGDAGDEQNELVKEEEVTEVPGWKPEFTATVLNTVSLGEENEECMFDERGKLYRFRDEE